MGLLFLWRFLYLWERSLSYVYMHVYVYACTYICKVCLFMPRIIRIYSNHSLLFYSELLQNPAYYFQNAFISYINYSPFKKIKTSWIIIFSKSLISIAVEQTVPLVTAVSESFIILLQIVLIMLKFALKCWNNSSISSLFQKLCYHNSLRSRYSHWRFWPPQNTFMAS